MNKFLFLFFLIVSGSFPVHYSQFKESYTVDLSEVYKFKEKGSIQWYRLTHKPLEYNNLQECGTPNGNHCAQSIEYFWHEVPALAGHVRIDLKDYPTIFIPGTHRFRLSAGFPQIAPTPANTTEIVIRRDNTYAGYVSELLGLPFIFWPRNTAPGFHQTDRRFGADCVATLIYGQRRLGHKVPYVAPHGLFRYIEPIPAKNNIQTIQVGDVLHFGHQTAILSQDKKPFGILNKDDMVIHAYPNSVREEKLGDLPYRFLAYRVYRWKTNPKLVR